MFANTFDLPWKLESLTAWFTLETDCGCLQKI